MNSKYLTMLNDLTESGGEHHSLSANSRTLVVDGTNTFIRAFTSDPTCNENGVHAGGITGFLKSIGYAIKLLAPTRVIIVFDGKGGSQRRRKVYDNYKGNRRENKHYNRGYHITDTQDELESMKMQLGRLGQYLQCLPVKNIMIDNIEADDAIAYIVSNPIDNEDNFYYIMSSDKDFYQLISDKVHVWSPTKKKLYTPDSLFEEYGVTSKNFIYYRIIDGDVSDNIDGIKGFGLKTIKKKLPILSENTLLSINDIIEYANNNDKKLHDTLLENRDKLERNYILMQLSDVDISGNAKLRIIEIIREKIPQLNMWTMKTMILEDYINTAFLNLDFWLKGCFEKINGYGMKYAK